ncbi:hypothetical protein Nepgr_009246 [Nepenthes gracilis]|uniref:Pentatricopeptide repeat-containing protein n=1 Tax=Nepenthes gracilis TaxID=150966 RepID=A0AAD3SAJ9_NEPGR|nr:hypothetical protein Nepgr_009246 [Nepenthes gracilis]
MGKESYWYIANFLENCIAQKSHKSGKLLHARILRTGLSSDTFLCNRLIDFYSKCSKIRSARHVFDKVPERDIFSWNAILSALCTANNLIDAHMLFDEMPERNVVSWNNMISAFVKCGDAMKALDFYTIMISEGLMPTHFTLASVLCACGILLDVDFGRKCHGLALKIGIDKNMYVGNALLSMYAKCRYIADAVKAFADLQEPNEVSFTALIGGLGDTENVGEALEMFKLMHRTRICIDAISLSCILGICATGKSGGSGLSHQNDSLLAKVNGQLIHCLSIKLGIDNDFHLMNSLLDMYAKNADMGSAERIFYILSIPSTVSWNIMIAGYGQNYQIGEAIEFMQRMECSGVAPDEVTFINMLSACVKTGSIEVGHQVFDKMPCPSLSSWNAILSGYSQIESHKETITLFREMQCRNVNPDRTTLAIILGSCAGMELLGCGKQVHAVSLKFSFHNDMYVGSGLITMYSKGGKMDKAMLVFNRLPELDIACWNSIMTGFSVNSLCKEAFVYFNLMRGRDVSPNQFSYGTLLSCCAEQSFSSQGGQYHCQIVKDGYINDVFVGSALIDMYCKCGDVEGARHLFDSFPSKNTVVWNEMMHGYAQNGCGEEAVHLYHYMIMSGGKPDGITFVAVLNACSHSGLVDEGMKIFESISSEHKMDPLLEHYTCIIDALGRASRLQEAEMLLNKMPCKDDPIIWEVLLSSCRVHTDVHVARKAAKKLLYLNPQNHTPYVLLANIYSSLGRWDEARALRELMSEKRVGKDPGFSWIEHKNGKDDSHVTRSK